MSNGLNSTATEPDKDHLELSHTSDQRDHGDSKSRAIVRSRSSRDNTDRRSRRRSRSRSRSIGRGASPCRRRSLTRSHNRARVRSTQVRGSGTISSLDASIRTRLIGILVCRSGVVVDDIDRLDIHRERRGGVVRLTTSPLDRTLRVIGVATGPDTDADAHGCLGVVGSVDGVGVLECADDFAVEEPFDSLGGPVDRVRVEGLFGSGDGHSCAAVVGCGVSFAEVVGLDLGVVGADLLLRYVSD